MEAYYKKISRDLVTVAHRPAKKVRGDEDARGAGYVAGTNARLSHGVDGSSSAEQEPLQIGR